MVLPETINYHDLYFLLRSRVEAEVTANLGKEKVPLQEYDPRGQVVPQVLQTEAEASAAFIRPKSTGTWGGF